MFQRARCSGAKAISSREYVCWNCLVLQSTSRRNLHCSTPFSQVSLDASANANSPSDTPIVAGIGANSPQHGGPQFTATTSTVAKPKKTSRHWKKGEKNIARTPNEPPRDDEVGVLQSDVASDVKDGELQSTAIPTAVGKPGGRSRHWKKGKNNTSLAPTEPSKDDGFGGLPPGVVEAVKKAAEILKRSNYTQTTKAKAKSKTKTKTMEGSSEVVTVARVTEMINDTLARLSQKSDSAKSVKKAKSASKVKMTSPPDGLPTAVMEAKDEVFSIPKDPLRPSTRLSTRRKVRSASKAKTTHGVSIPSKSRVRSTMARGPKINESDFSKERLVTTNGGASILNRSVLVRSKALGKSRTASERTKTKTQTKEEATWDINVDGAVEIQKFVPKDLRLEAIGHDTCPIPKLAHGLNRVLFTRGVVQFRDLHSRVYNFDPEIEMIPPLDKIDYKTLSNFTPPSKDSTLAKIAEETQKKFIGSTSSMTGLLKQFHSLLSGFRSLNHTMFSKSNTLPNTVTKITRAPESIFLNYKDGIYAVDGDKEFDSPNVLSLMGRYMEKLFTNDKKTFEKYKASAAEELHAQEEPGEAYHYSTIGDFLLRSQLDAHDKRLPGSGVFDLKTRACLPIRMSSEDFEPGMDYEVNAMHGEMLSFEREIVDMSRATLGKYMLQARIGRMDGIFVAYHNIARIFGFQYFSISDMDAILHGQEDRTLGDQEFLASMRLLNELFTRAIERFPNQSLRILVEAPDTRKDPSLFFFAEPMESDQIKEVQNARKARIEDWEKAMVLSGEVPAEDESVFANIDGDIARFRRRAKAIRKERMKEHASKDQTRLRAKHNADGMPKDNATRPDSEASSETGPTETSDEVVNMSNENIVEPLTIKKITGVEDAEMGFQAQDPSSSTHEGAPSSSEEYAETNMSIEDLTAASEAPALEIPAAGETSMTASETAPNETFEIDAFSTTTTDTTTKTDEVPTTTNNIHGPILALRLKTKNKINGEYEATPKNVTEKSTWEVEYQIDELPLDIATKVYQQVRARRRFLLWDGLEAMKAQSLSGKHQTEFQRALQAVNQRSKKWRTVQDGLDTEKERQCKGVYVWDREGPVKRSEFVMGGEDEKGA